uniref:Rhodanese domain-containing protein n=1 Tax=Ditylum brightwellii TaxID=49249 RepID=A0A7S4ST56_9STRA
MYCTGGIRCEKASAFIRRETGAESVQHLKGGIHKYLDKYGADGLFHGKNFVFDRRVGAEASSHMECSKKSKEPVDNVVGRCLYCEKPFDTFTPDGVCTVCREPTLVCDSCKTGLVEYHCSDHIYLRNCYFSDLSRFNELELKNQLAELEEHLQRMAIGKRYKQKRKTLHRQCDRVLEALGEASSSIEVNMANGTQSQTKCRNCGAPECGGDCWGFHGLGRKDKISEKNVQSSKLPSRTKARATRSSANQRPAKLEQKERDIAEIRALGLAAAPSAYRSADSSLRCPPPCIRTLISSVKGKWCGKTILSVLQSEFADLSDAEYLSSLMSHSLIHLNGIPVKCDAIGLDGDSQAISASSILKNMDTISRIVHWYEPPVIVPSSISVQKIKIPDDIISENSLCDNYGNSNEALIYCCDKPASVPVHPAGPYLANSLTMMVEGQVGLEPRSLRPCHRLDRCTSGLTICTTSQAIAKLIQGRLDGKTVQKLYLARVKGKFPSSENECQNFMVSKECASASWSWMGDKCCIEVNAPIKNIDPIKGYRAICNDGKHSTSRFSLVSYEETSDMSIVACYPVTGRGHQLRVHLQWLGHAIHGDVLYGGPNYLLSMKEDAIKALVDASKTGEESQGLPNKLISENAAVSAKNLCRISRDGVDGIQASFSSAQLLGGGHVIDLHAWKYRVSFERKGRKTKKCKIDAGTMNSREKDQADVDDALVLMDFATNVPLWAKSCECENVSWL